MLDSKLQQTREKDLFEIRIKGATYLLMQSLRKVKTSLLGEVQNNIT